MSEFQSRHRGKVRWPWKRSADRKSQDYDVRFVRWLADNKFVSTPERAEREVRAREYLRKRSSTPKIGATEEIVEAWYGYRASIEEEERKPVAAKEVEEDLKPMATAKSAREMREKLRSNPQMAAIFQRIDRVRRDREQAPEKPYSLSNHASTENSRSIDT